MAFRDFDATRARAQREPVRFRLGGQDFTCTATPSIAQALDLARAPEPDLTDMESATTGQAVAALIRFIESLLVSKSDQKRWRRVLRSKRDPISAQDIIELGTWLTVQYTARPTRPPSESSDGRAPTGTTSTSSRFDPATKGSET